MSSYRCRWWRDERGSQGLEAAGAALAAALLVLALLFGAGLLGPRVEQAFQCAASALSGGGGCANGSGDASQAPNSATQSDEKPWWQDAWGWLKGQASDLWEMITDPGVLVGLGVGIGVALLLLAAPISVPALAILAIAGASGALAGTLAGNAAHGLPLTENLLRNTLLGAGGGLLAAVLGESLLAITAGGMALNTLNNLLTGQRWDKGLLASGLLAFVLAWGGSKVLPREEPVATRPGVEEPGMRVPGDEADAPARVPGCAFIAPHGKGPGLAAPAMAKCTPQETAQRISEDAQAGKIKRPSSSYHGRLPQALEQEILSSPDAVYLSSGKSGRMIYLKGDNIVVVESAGSARGNVVTSYGPAGPRGESGAAIFGGAPDDPGLPITPEMIENGSIPVPSGGTLPPATKISP